MSSNNCPFCSTGVPLLEDGKCPECGRNETERAVDVPDAPANDLSPPNTNSPLEIHIETADLAERQAEDAIALPPPGFLSAVGWCLVLLLAQAGIGCVLGSIFALSDTLSVFLTDRAALVYFLPVGHLVMLGLGWKLLEPDARKQLAIRPMSFLHVAIAFLLVLPMAILAMKLGDNAEDAYDALFGSMLSVGDSGIGSAVGYTGLYDGVFDLIAQLPWGPLILIGCVLPGICEEVFLRGFIGRGLLARYGVFGGVALTSLLFGLLHVDPVHAFYAFLLGALLHCVYLFTRSLWAPVLVHSLINLAGFTTRRWTLEGTLAIPAPDGSIYISLPLFASSAVAVAGLIFFLYQTRVRFYIHHENEEEKLWCPGYVTSAMPTDSKSAIARSNAPSKLAWPIAIVSYALFGCGLIYTGFDWGDSDSAWAHLYRGSQHEEQEEYDEAITAYSKAIEVDPELIDAYLGRGEACRMLGEYDRALVDFDLAIEIDPKSAEAHASRAEVLRLLDRLDEALAECSGAIELEPDYAWAYSVRGAVHVGKGDIQKAVSDYRIAIRLDPRYPWAHEALAQTLVHAQKDIPNAIGHARRACELTDWSDPYTLETLAKAYAADGQFGFAVRYQITAMDLAPSDEQSEFLEQLESYKQKRSAKEYENHSSDDGDDSAS